MPKRTLFVLSNGILVGEYVQNPDGGCSFTYDSAYLNSSGAEVLTLSMPLRTKPYVGQTVINYFDNLLPDNKLIRDRIVARYKIPSDTAFNILEAIGRDCVGSIQLTEENDISVDVTGITIKPLDELGVSSVLNGLLVTGSENTNLDDFRISLAGAHEKTGLLKTDTGWGVPLGTTPSTHIFKLPIGMHQTSSGSVDLTDSVENEWLCLWLARELGLPAAHAEISSFNGTKALVVTRFDRTFDEDQEHIYRNSQEDFCQVFGFPSSLKYQSDGGPSMVDCMKVIKGSDHPEFNQYMFMLYQIYQLLIAAPDGHAKNYSIQHAPDNTYWLAPLYDVMSGYPFMGPSFPKQKLKLAMGFNGTTGIHYLWQKIQARHIIETLRQCGFKGENLIGMSDALKEFCKHVPYTIDEVRGKIPQDFPAHIADPIFDGVKNKAQSLYQNWPEL